jgi:hypothetical protein
LHFLSNKDQFPQKCTQLSNFNDIYETGKKRLSDLRFHEFVEDCKIVYEESELKATKVVVLILVEKVAQKFIESLKKVERARAASSQTINADQSGATLMSHTFRLLLLFAFFSR